MRHRSPLRRLVALAALAAAGPLVAAGMTGCSVLDKLRGGAEIDAAPSASSAAATPSSAPTAEEPALAASSLAAPEPGRPAVANVAAKDAGVIDAGPTKDAGPGILTPLPPGMSAIPLPSFAPSNLPKLPPMPSGIVIPRLPASVKIPVTK